VIKQRAEILIMVDEVISIGLRLVNQIRRMRMPGGGHLVLPIPMITQKH